MFVAFKRNGTKDIFQKHCLKYVLCIGVIFQMYCTEPPDSIGIPFNSSDCLLFIPHIASFCYLQRLPRKPFPQPPPWRRPGT